MSQDGGADGGVPEDIGVDGTADDHGSADRHASKEQLLYAGMGLTYLVAAIHLFHPSSGFPRLVEIALIGRPGLLLGDPRPLVFVVSAVLLIVGANLVLANRWRRPLYLAGIVVVAAYFVGYFLWHFTGHGGFLPGREPLYHGLSPLENVVSHLTTDVLAAASKVLEVALLAVLVALYRREGD